MADGKTFTPEELHREIQKKLAPLQEQIEELTDKAEKAEAKKQEALDEAKRAKAEARKHKDIDPAEYQAQGEENDQLKADLAEANRQIKTITAERDKAVSSLEAEQAVTHKLVAENGVIKALSDAGVSDPAYLEAAKAMHLPNVKVVAEGEDRKALYGDKDIVEAIKEWAGGDVGKKFVSAPDNSGGGAPGGKGGGSEKTMTRAEYNERIVSDPKGTNTFLKEGGKIVDQAA